MKIFVDGFKGMLPISPGVIPFGAVMGTVCSEAHLTFFQTISMNVLVFAGASQLAAVNLMSKNTPALVVIATGLIINLRFILYSAAMSPVVQKSNFLVKLTTSYFLTDQSYAVMTANETKLKNTSEMIEFYLGSALCMVLVWQGSVIAGFIFGNFAPASWNLDYAIPLSFITLTIPTLKNKIYVAVAVFSSVVAVLLKPVPYNLGLIVTAVLAIGLSILLTHRSHKSHS
jgi:predicted branched-subunit amino acid permease